MLTLRVSAPAKINLYLHVLGRRLDGYHLLDSLVAFPDIGDEIEARSAETLSLSVDGPFAAALAGPGEDNLVLRAARLLAAYAGREPKAALRLTKKLPVASGIGGGSSDAAATLRLLTQLWGLSPSEPELAGIGARLGADVPVCLAGEASWLGGIGETIEPAPSLPAAGIVLANPGIALATPAVFKARQGPFSPPGRFAAVASDTAELAALLRQRRNDLAPAAIGIVPEIEAVLAKLDASPGALLARMSGSGATCFALYASRAAAERASVAIAATAPRWWVASGELLSRAAP
jgi:4-diphosphocytidyl-2-C-methyl-D-erythritol kinase